MTITEKKVLNAIKDYKNIKAKIAKLEAELEEAKAVILAGMGDADTAEAKVNGVAITVTNKTVTSTRIDTKKLKAKYPKIAAECSTTSASPRFIVK